MNGMVFTDRDNNGSIRERSPGHVLYEDCGYGNWHLMYKPRQDEWERRARKFMKSIRDCKNAFLPIEVAVCDPAKVEDSKEFERIAAEIRRQPPTLF